jgi:hypothetical protein
MKINTNKVNAALFGKVEIFLPCLMLLFFGVQSLAGIAFLGGRAAYEFLGIFVLGMGAYWISIKATEKYAKKNKWDLVPGRGNGFFIFCVSSISVLYFSVVFIALITAEKVALWEALTGATSFEIAEAREMLFRSRSDGRSLLYLSSILSSAFMPYIIMLCFIRKSKMAWPLFIIFSISLTLSLEKALILKAMLPMFLLAANGYVPKRMLYLSPLLAIITLVGMNHLARGTDNGASGGVIAVSTVDAYYGNNVDNVDFSRRINLRQGGEFMTLGQHVLKYYPLRGETGLGYLANRMLWIPYITAYDWLKYFDEEMGRKHAMGSTSLLVSKLTGVQQLPMERNIFAYQFGLAPGQSAGANANFLVDGFINFGNIGVIVLSALIGFGVAYFKKQQNPAALACLYFFLFQLSGGGFLGVLLGGGLLFFIFLVLVLRPDPKDCSVGSQ